jgi:cyclic beta-1,2-glucan synthetase
MAEEDRILFQAAARAIMADDRGALGDQINDRSTVKGPVPLHTPTRTHRSEPLVVAPLPRDDLRFHNGLVGFTPDGREYVITTAHGHVTPLPCRRATPYVTRHGFGYNVFWAEVRSPVTGG